MDILKNIINVDYTHFNRKVRLIHGMLILLIAMSQSLLSIGYIWTISLHDINKPSVAREIDGQT